MGGVARRATAKFRYNAALAIAGFVALCGAVPLAASRWYLWFILLVPVAVMMWGARAGVDVRDGGLAVRWAVGGRHVDASRITGFTITHRAVRAVLDDNRRVWLPAVPGTRVPVLAEAVGLTLARPAAPASDTPESDTAEPTTDTTEPTTRHTGTVDPAAQQPDSAEPAARQSNATESAARHTDTIEHADDGGTPEPSAARSTENAG